MSTTRDTTPADGYADRLLKLLPAELTGAYLAVRSMIGAGNPENDEYLLYFCLLILLISPFFMRFALGMRWLNSLFLAASLFVWMFNIDIEKLVKSREAILVFFQNHIPALTDVISFVLHPTFAKLLIVVWALLLVPLIMRKGKNAP